MRDVSRASVSFRIGVPQWLTDERFAGLMEIFEQHKGVTDEITFFTSETHAPLTLEETRQRCDILKMRMAEVRRLGYGTGINILATIGHHEENLDNSLTAGYANVTDIEGKVSRGSFCPNDPDFLEQYVRPVYEMLTAAEPDFIWVDDDVRLRGHLPILNTCFCDRCVTIFSERVGQTYSRESLQAAFNQESPDKRLEIRKAWLAHNSKTIGDLLRFIEQVVHGLAPTMPLGFMDGGRYYEGYDMEGWADALAGADDVEVLWRPGGGTYTEEVPDDVMIKAHVIGREAAALPDKVVRIQSELENFNYQRLKKSEQFTALEAACYIAAGCTGTAFNVLSMYDEPLDEYESLMKRLTATRPFLDKMAATLSKAQPAGIHTGWNRNIFAARNATTGDWFKGNAPVPGLIHADEMFKIGLPVAYDSGHACVTTLAGEGVLALSDEEIQAIMSKGVYMDATALAVLNERGYGDLTGFNIAWSSDRDCIEQLVEHELNGDFAGRHRDGRQSFWTQTAYALEPTISNAEVISQLVDYTYQQTAACTTGVFENRLGGRVCVAGYYPWEQLQYLSKTTQLKRIMRWLSGDSLGAYVESYHRIAIWDRVMPDGSHAFALANLYLDPAENVSLMLKTNKDAATVYDMYCNETTITAQGETDGYKRFTLPKLAPWHIGLVTQ